jgi:hypothetical protein
VAPLDSSDAILDGSDAPLSGSDAPLDGPVASRVESIGRLDVPRALLGVSFDLHVSAACLEVSYASLDVSCASRRFRGDYGRL